MAAWVAKAPGVCSWAANGPPRQGAGLLCLSWGLCCVGDASHLQTGRLSPGEECALWATGHHVTCQGPPPFSPGVG